MENATLKRDSGDAVNFAISIAQASSKGSSSQDSLITKEAELDTNLHANIKSFQTPAADLELNLTESINANKILCDSLQMRKALIVSSQASALAHFQLTDVDSIKSSHGTNDLAEEQSILRKTYPETRERVNTWLNSSDQTVETKTKAAGINAKYNYY